VPRCGVDARSLYVPLLDIHVTATEAGLVMTLSGEADVTTVAQLQEALDEQITPATRILLVEVSGLRFADSATIGVLIVAARRLKDQGGRLDLLNPQPALARMMTLLGVDRVVTLRGAGPESPGPFPPPSPDDRGPVG
jgi:stage II sporulation protein AA (anti-sigma F factor antagonist)